MNKHIISLSGKAKRTPLQIPWPVERSSKSKFNAVGRTANTRSYDDLMAGLSDCRSSLGKIESDYRKRLNTTLEALYGYAQDLMKRKDWWEKFCQNITWQGTPPSARNSKLALRYVLKWACASTRESQQSASLYYRALKGFWKSNVSRDQIATRISEKGGIRKLAEKNSEKRKPARAAPAETIAEPAISAPTVDKPREKSRDDKKRLEVHSMVATFDGGFDVWKRLKKGTRVSMEMTLDEMGGRAAQITVHEVTML